MSTHKHKVKKTQEVPKNVQNDLSHPHQFSLSPKLDHLFKVSGYTFLFSLGSLGKQEVAVKKPHKIGSLQTQITHWNNEARWQNKKLVTLRPIINTEDRKSITKTCCKLKTQAWTLAWKVNFNRIKSCMTIANGSISIDSALIQQVKSWKRHHGTNLQWQQQNPKKTH